VAYDEELAHRIREQLDGRRYDERSMFGGLAFLVDGHMAVAASRSGALLCRIDPADGDHLVASTGAEPMVMGGRSLKGWLHVPAAELRTKRQLAAWVRRAVSFVDTLPPKEPKDTLSPKEPKGSLLPKEPKGSSPARRPRATRR